MVLKMKTISNSLEVEYEGLSVADVLEMSIEDGVGFFADVSSVSGKLEFLDDLGLGYLTLGQAATTLSGGEAQRVKLAKELANVRLVEAGGVEKEVCHVRG
mgnify:CR=1 FL=1